MKKTHSESKNIQSDALLSCNENKQMIEIFNSNAQVDSSDTISTNLGEDVVDYWGNKGKLLYPTSAGEDLAKNYKFDVCFLMHDTMKVYKPVFPLLEGLPVAPYRWYNADSIRTIMGNYGYNIECSRYDADYIYFVNNLDTFFFVNEGSKTRLISITTTSNSYSFDSIKVGERIDETSLLGDFLRAKHLRNSIKVLKICNSPMYSSSLEDDERATVYPFNLAFSIDNGIVTKSVFLSEL